MSWPLQRWRAKIRILVWDTVHAKSGSVPENEFLKLIYLSRAMASTSCNIWMDRSMGASNADTRKILPDTRKLLESCTDTRILGLTPRKHGWGLEAGERGAFSGDAKILGR